jgi:hypothetical protein
MSIHLEIYVVDQAGVLITFWRRTIEELRYPLVGAKYLLEMTKTRQKWFFPDGGAQHGEHFDTRLDTYVVWIQTPNNYDYEPWGFTSLDLSRAS